MIAPNSSIVLLKTPMELNDSNTLSFSTETAKHDYFLSLPKLRLDDATYQRKEDVVRYPTNPPNTSYEDLLQYNYCMYQNTSYDNKWFYAYIDDIKYINDNMCEIKLRTDAFMTWQNDITYKASFIERQHVSDDTIGKHTIPENLETGEYIENPLTSSELTDWQALTGTCYVVLGLSEPPYGIANVPASLNDYHMYGGVYSALWYVTFSSSTDCTKFINDIQGQFSSDIIVTAFMVPQIFLQGNVNYVTPSGKDFQVGYIESYNGLISLSSNLELNKPSSIDGYVPKNNKCFCYPYTYLMISNNIGENNIYRYEFFNSSKAVFSLNGVLSVGCSIKCFPVNYNYSSSLSYTDRHYIHSTNMAKLPTCSWNNDAYTNWLTANSVDLAVGIGAGAVATIAGGAMIATGVGAVAGAGLMAGGINSIYNSIKADYKASLVPDTAKGGINQGDIVFSGNATLLPTQFTVRNEYIKSIDSFFTMFGYKVNSLEVINPHKRTYFDYIKTIGCNIIGNIPQKDMEEIRNLFDNGLTIWHEPTKFLDYSVNNTIL